MTEEAVHFRDKGKGKVEMKKTGQDAPFKG